MTLRIALALFALFVLASNAWAEVHPNAKKIAKWEGGIAKRQAKIDAENARGVGIASTVQYVPGASVQVRIRTAPVVVQAAPDFTLSTPAPVVQEAPPAEVVVPAPQVIIQAPPVVRYVAPVRVYRAPVYRSYYAAPVLGCPIFGAMAANYHARQAERHSRKADYHAARAGL